MTLYVVHGNTYYDGYGHIENIFGIYKKKDEAEAAKDLTIKELYRRYELCAYFTELHIIHHFHQFFVGLTVG